MCGVDCEPYICVATLLLNEHIFDGELVDFVLNFLLERPLHSRSPILADLANLDLEAVTEGLCHRNILLVAVPRI